MKDEDFAVLLSAISHQNQLKSIVYQNNDFGKYSCVALSEILMKSAATDESDASNGFNPLVQMKLDTLKLSNLKANQLILERTLFTLDEQVDSKKLRVLKLSGLNLNHQSMVGYICNQFALNPGLQEFDMSYAKINTPFFR